MLLTDDMLDFTDVFECFQSKIYASLGVPADQVLRHEPKYPVVYITDIKFHDSKPDPDLMVPHEIVFTVPVIDPIESLTINICTKPKSDPNYPHKCSKCESPSWNNIFNGKINCSNKDCCNYCK